MTEVCPNCGNLVEELNDITGWCHICTPTEDLNNIDGDRIDILRGQGMSRKDAITQARQERQPTCVICENKIKGGSPGSNFCGTNLVCSKAGKHYKYLRYDKGLDKEQALAQTIARFKEQQ